MGSIVGTLHKMIGRNRILSRFAGNRGGSTAVEFALLAPIFFFTLLSAFDVGLLFGTSVMMEASTTAAARAVRTGKVFEAAAQETAFRDALCKDLILIPCSDISYDVQAFTNFAGANTDVSCNTDGRIDPYSFDIGGPLDVVVVTVLIRYESIIPLPKSDWRINSDNSCGGIILMSTAVFRNEPF